MSSQMIFQRVEFKYLITRKQQEAILRAMGSEMIPDPFFHSSIRNIYYDTPSYQLIRQSLDKPIYKEKLRLRCYGRAGDSEPVFVELKKKYDGIVYKRRMMLPQRDATRGLEGHGPLPETQIANEISYVLRFYPELRPRVFLSYERDSYCSSHTSGVRITFDDQIRWRTNELTLNSEPYGVPLLPDDLVLMEVKLPQAMPLWLARALSAQGISKTSFSKYGAAYLQVQSDNQKGVLLYA